MKIQELLSLIPEGLLESVAEKTQVNKHVKKLDSKTIFNLYLYSFIEEDRISLRQMNKMFSSILRLLLYCPKCRKNRFQDNN
jgi:hypothetical protein